MEPLCIQKETFKEAGIGSLLHIPQPPDELYIKGVLPDPRLKRLAVVGSRALSSYGREACNKLIGGLAGYPVSIVSGLALGADAAAHKAALLAGLHTIAVPGSGLSRHAIAPKTNLSLADAILKAGGALLSEHPPETVARPEYFPSRNRIMVGLSDAVLMVEAAEQSGTLITARLAADYNRDLLAVPHRIGDPHGHGANLFIRLGATLVADATHILEALGIEAEKEPASGSVSLPEGPERTLYELLQTPHAKDELIRLSRLSTGSALTALISLELKGLIKEEFGLWRRVHAHTS